MQVSWAGWFGPTARRQTPSAVALRLEYGSYVTTKAKPRDIDFVMLIEHETFDRHEQLIESRFRRHKAKQEYGKIDAYTVKMYPEGHERYFVTEYDLVYWRGLFTETKRNRAKKKFPKGFIEIKFGKFKAEGHE